MFSSKMGRPFLPAVLVMLSLFSHMFVLRDFLGLLLDLLFCLLYLFPLIDPQVRQVDICINNCKDEDDK